jgi:glutamate carboxypeptidase
MIAQLTAHATEHLPEALAWLRRMVEINSFTTNVEGIDAVGRVTAEAFAPLGFAAEFIAAEEPTHGPHLFLRREGSGAARPVVLVTHLDTVFPPQEELANQFHWSDEGMRIYGPGSVDNKGGTMLIWLMLKIMSEVNRDLFEATTWLVAANSAEEVMSGDFARRCGERCAQGARCLLVFEGGPVDETGYHLVTARKGRLEYRLTCTGRAAHAGSNFELGINALVELARMLPQIHGLSDPSRSLSVNVANLHAGTVLNRVPHHAVAELEMRAFDPQALEEAAAALEALAGTTAGGAALSIERLGATAAWPGGHATEALFAHWQRAGAALMLPVLAMARGGLSDSNYLSHLGPTLDGMGPSGGNAHCSQRSSDGSKMPEYVEPHTLVPKAVMNVLGLQAVLREADQ